MADLTISPTDWDLAQAWVAERIGDLSSNEIAPFDSSLFQFIKDMPELCQLCFRTDTAILALRDSIEP